MQAISEGDSSDSDADDLDLVEKRCNRDGTIASGTAAELRLERELAKDPWGRFGGRNGKLARIRAQEAALQALQGGNSTSVTFRKCTSVLHLLKILLCGNLHCSSRCSEESKIDLPMDCMHLLLLWKAFELMES